MIGIALLGALFDVAIIHIFSSIAESTVREIKIDVFNKII